jgi:hypothetical protein
MESFVEDYNTTYASIKQYLEPKFHKSDNCEYFNIIVATILVASGVDKYDDVVNIEHLKKEASKGI